MQGVRGPLGEMEGVARRQMRKAGFLVHREGLSRRQDAVCVLSKHKTLLRGPYAVGPPPLPCLIDRVLQQEFNLWASAALRNTRNLEVQQESGTDLRNNLQTTTAVQRPFRD